MGTVTYDALLHTLAGRPPVRYVVSGAAGDFGRTLTTQRTHPYLTLAAACDLDLDALVETLTASGYARQDIRPCATTDEVRAAADAHQVIAVTDYRLLDEVAADVLVEATGHPSASLDAAEAALRRHVHVVMVSKETDSVAGPYLGRLARQHGVAYTPAAGDQPGNLIALLAWARLLGLDVVAAGKASEQDYVYDPDSGAVRLGKQSTTAPELGDLLVLGNDVPTLMRRRRESIGELSQPAAAAYCEMGIVANAANLATASDELSFPLCRISELAEVFIPSRDGGVLDREGVVDVFDCLRLPNEASFGGGVFVVARCTDPYVTQMLGRKGHLVSRNGQYVCVYLPHHLLGVETPISILSTAVYGRAAGTIAQPRTILAARATRDLKQGSTLELDHHHELAGIRAVLVQPDDQSELAVPFYLAAGHQLRADVPEGAIVGPDMVDLDTSSGLYRAWQQGMAQHRANADG